MSRTEALTVARGDDGVARSDVEDESGLTHCHICTEEYDGAAYRPTVGPCEHLGTCSLCFLRLRKLLDDFSCCQCKAQLDSVFVFESVAAVRPYKSLNLWGENAGPGYVYEDSTRMFMPKEFHKDVYQTLQAPYCRAGCGAKCGSLKGLKDHIRTKHELFFCEVCLEHKKAFLGEQMMYSKADLARHRDKGEPGLGFFGHPSCQFCGGKRFYDTMSLYQHFVRDHYSCDLCERQGIRHKYYRDYNDLEKHFRSEHFLCEDPTCRAQRFIVFANPIDYQAHMLKEHPEMGGSKKVMVAFKVKGAPQRGGPRREEETDTVESVSLEQPRSPRDEGEITSFQMTSEMFPDLSDESARRSRSRFGGLGAPTRFGAARFTGADFPTLGGGGGAAAAGGGGFRNAVAAYPSRGAVLARDRDQRYYPEVDLGNGQGQRGGKKKKGGGQQQQPPPPPPRTPSPPRPPPPPGLGGGPQQQQGHGSPGHSRSPPEVMAEIEGLIGCDAFAELRGISQQLKRGELEGTEYYDAVINLIPHRDMRLKVMSDLLQLLPQDDAGLALRNNIQELMQLRDGGGTDGDRSSRSSPHPHPPPPPPPPPPPHNASPSPAEAAAASSSYATPKAKAKKGPSKGAPRANDWAKAIASVAGGSSSGKSGVTLVKFSAPGAGKAAQRSGSAPPRTPTSAGADRQSAASIASGTRSGSASPRDAVEPTQGELLRAVRKGWASGAGSDSEDEGVRPGGKGKGARRGAPLLSSQEDYPPLPTASVEAGGGAGEGGAPGVVEAEAGGGGEGGTVTKKKKAKAKKLNDLQMLAFNLR